MTGKSFLSNTAALLTAVGTLLAALVALAILLVGEGVLLQQDGGDSDPPRGDAGVFEERYGRQGTTGLELDGEKGIIRNPANDADLLIYESTRRIQAFRATLTEWEQDKAPTREECAKLLETHGKFGTVGFEMGDRFCVRSSKGRTALLAVISEGEEFKVTVWAGAGG